MSKDLGDTVWREQLKNEVKGDVGIFRYRGVAVTLVASGKLSH